MKEVTYEDWQKNPTPRMMWVWNSNVENKVQAKVIYVIKHKPYRVITVTDNDADIIRYGHCAEIEKQRRMTEEEKAKEWVRTNSGYSTKEFHGQKAIEAFLAGVEAGKSQAETDLAIVAYMQRGERYKLKWHDLRNNPNDLPEPYTTVLDENGNKVEYIGYGKWQVYSEYYERYSEVDPPIAWCKIPTFKE